MIPDTYSYYSEEQTITAPAARPATGGYKLYGKGLRDLDDVDLDGLLSKLSPEELEDLNNDFDPDVSFVDFKCLLFLFFSTLGFVETMLLQIS